MEAKEEDKTEFKLDFNKYSYGYYNGNKEIWLEDATMNYLIDQMYEYECQLYGYDRKGSNHFLSDKTAFYNRYKAYITGRVEGKIIGIFDDPYLEFIAAQKLMLRRKKYVYQHMCTECDHNPSKVIVYDCGHFCLCSECLEKLVKISGGCPICGKEIKKISIPTECHLPFKVRNYLFKYYVENGAMQVEDPEKFD